MEITSSVILCMLVVIASTLMIIVSALFLYLVDLLFFWLLQIFIIVYSFLHYWPWLTFQGHTGHGKANIELIQDFEPKNIVVVIVTFLKKLCSQAKLTLTFLQGHRGHRKVNINLVQDCPEASKQSLKVIVTVLELLLHSQSWPWPNWQGHKGQH